MTEIIANELTKGLAMKTSKILELIKMVESHDIEEIEISQWGSKIKISKSGAHIVSASAPVQNIQTSPNPIPTPEPITTVPTETQEVETELNANTIEIKTPMVGTMYRSPAPDSDPFVKVGDQISKGQTLCIIEAMKVMNEIESEVSGTLIKILVESSEPVEFDQVLFVVEKS